jgi:hypothetical protein
VGTPDFDLDDDRPATFREEDDAEARRFLPGQFVRWGLAFAFLFAGVFFCFWWSGSAIRFSAARVADRATPTLRVKGVVRNAATGEPLPWAKVEDDPAGTPPFFRTEADRNGEFRLLTLTEPHHLRVTVSGFSPGTIQVGRQWFVWWPHGDEECDIRLSPE